jgi:16S rRNA (guanine527-N7)-methyltransferase
VKHLHEQYIHLVQSGPNGLFSKADLGRLQAHVDDGIAGARVVAALNPTTVVDIGSGGGVPGIPVAIELPDVSMYLVESQAWKADFLRTCAHALNLDSRVKVHALRVEEAVAEIGRESIDVGTARAVAAPLVVAEYLAPLVRVGGHLALWSTEAQAADASVAPHELLGLGAPTIEPAPSPLRADGVIIVWPRTAPCSDRVPRRTGVASRRPLR